MKECVHRKEERRHTIILESQHLLDILEEAGALSVRSLQSVGCRQGGRSEQEVRFLVTRQWTRSSLTKTHAACVPHVSHSHLTLHSPEVTATTWPLSRTAASTSPKSRKSCTVVPRISSLWWWWGAAGQWGAEGRFQWGRG